jgi:hypothetical protein
MAQYEIKDGEKKLIHRTKSATPIPQSSKPKQGKKV